MEHYDEDRYQDPNNITQHKAREKSATRALWSPQRAQRARARAWDDLAGCPAADLRQQQRA